MLWPAGEMFAKVYFFFYHRTRLCGAGIVPEEMFAWILPDASAEHHVKGSIDDKFPVGRIHADPLG